MHLATSKLLHPLLCIKPLTCLQKLAQHILQCICLYPTTMYSLCPDDLGHMPLWVSPIQTISISNIRTKHNKHASGAGSANTARSGSTKSTTLGDSSLMCMLLLSSAHSSSQIFPPRNEPMQHLYRTILADSDPSDHFLQHISMVSQRSKSGL